MADEQNKEVAPKKSSGMAIAALVCGILSLVGACFGVGAWAGVVLGIVAVVLGVMANKAGKDTKATAGMVMGIIGLAISAIVAISCTICTMKAKKALKELDENWGSYSEEWDKAMKELEDIDWSSLLDE
ncbi:MAG: DUF4190 domain-containing protein [Treponema sp.]|nr:DUF4190 domain-containing protein [Treponema sp.]